MFNVAERVLASGEPVLIAPNGQNLLLIAQEKPSKIARLTNRGLIVGDANDLPELQLSEWQESNNSNQ